jgi:pimeloyl-ACP methyl ester carboxylesterase
VWYGSSAACALDAGRRRLTPNGLDDSHSLRARRPLARRRRVGRSRRLRVFALHGTPGCRLIEPDEEQLVGSLGIRLITYDRPGYGGSDRRPGRRIADCVEDVAAIASALGVGQFSVCGGSSGGPHALAVAALLAPRVVRVACVAGLAPYDALGEDWYRGAHPEVLRVVASLREGEDHYAADVAREDTELREKEPDDPVILEQTRNGVWGWVDDDLSLLAPWGFDPSAISAPTAIWYDPRDTVALPRHSKWLAGAIAGAIVSMTDALGHGSDGNRDAESRRLYSWLVEG